MSKPNQNPVACYCLCRWSCSCVGLTTILEIVKSIDLEYVNCNNSGNLKDSVLPRQSSQHELDVEKKIPARCWI